MSDGKWIIPVARNNWNSVKVFYGQPALTDWGTWAQDAGVEEIKPGPCLVRWSDGSEELAVIREKPYSVETPDMGHTNTTTGKMLVLVFAHHGSLCEVPLASSGIPLRLSPPDFALWHGAKS